MHSQKTIVYAIIAALIGILAIGGLLSINSGDIEHGNAPLAAGAVAGNPSQSSEGAGALTAATAQPNSQSSDTASATNGTGNTTHATTPAHPVASANSAASAHSDATGQLAAPISQQTARAKQETATQTAQQSDTSTHSQPEGWPRQITDSRGTTTTLPRPPQRIVSLAPSVTQTLRAIGAENALVAIPREGSDPSEAAELVRLSVYPAPSPEAILALRPDLLLGADITSPAIAERLRSFGLPVIILGGSGYDGIVADIARAGQATGHDTTAAILTEALTSLLNEVRAEVAATEPTAKNTSEETPPSARSESPSPLAPQSEYLQTATPQGKAEPAQSSPANRNRQALLFIGASPDYAAGPGSYSADLLTIAGGENLAAKLKQPWPLLSREFILEANPHLLIFTVESTAITSPVGAVGRSETLNAYLRADPVWSQLGAVRANRVYAIDQNLLNVPGPHVGEALTQLRAIIRNTEAEAEAASPHVEMSSGHFQP